MELTSCHSTGRQTLESWAVGCWWAVEPDDPEMSQQQWDWTVQVWYLPLRLRIPFCWLQAHSSSAPLLTGCSSVKVEHSHYCFSPFWMRTSLLRSCHKLSCFVSQALGMFLQAALLIIVWCVFQSTTVLFSVFTENGLESSSVGQSEGIFTAVKAKLTTALILLSVLKVLEEDWLKDGRIRCFMQRAGCEWVVAECGLWCLHWCG